MKDAEKNRDPKRAIKRAANDLRCAVRKLGKAEALAIIAAMPDAPGHPKRATA